MYSSRAEDGLAESQEEAASAPVTDQSVRQDTPPVEAKQQQRQHQRADDSGRHFVDLTLFSQKGYLPGPVVRHCGLYVRVWQTSIVSIWGVNSPAPTEASPHHVHRANPKKPSNGVSDSSSCSWRKAGACCGCYCCCLASLAMRSSC